MNESNFVASLAVCAGILFITLVVAMKIYVSQIFWQKLVHLLLFNVGPNKRTFAPIFDLAILFTLLFSFLFFFLIDTKTPSA